ncbi:hypothetical protein [Erythrobacter westpacificensis]|uniref:hypothetical protein n=1 Tax=Erythrobacter westpacificensis TaxID=1055231 RepID=UPI0031F7A6FB
MIFPYIEPLTVEEIDVKDACLDLDVGAIKEAKFANEADRALDEAQRVAAAETERVRTAESKATTYLAVLAALVPLVITLQAATWEDKSGPAPEGLKLGIMFIATVYLAAAGYHAFRTLQVSGFQRVAESEVAAAWRTPRPLQKLARSTLLASRRSRDAVNAKVTRIKVTHQHLVRAFGAFVLLLSLDPIFYALDFVWGEIGSPVPMEVEQTNELPESRLQVPEVSTTPGTSVLEPEPTSIATTPEELSHRSDNSSPEEKGSLARNQP